MNKTKFRLAAPLVGLVALPVLSAPPDRISARIDNSRIVQLRARAPRFAIAQNDKGPLPAAQRIVGMSLMFKPSSAQQSDLNQLIEAQQNPKSPDYHRWLTPEQYAGRFGASGADIGKIETWLKSQGFSVDYVARGGDYISFSGNAQQVATAFHIQLHKYDVGGKTYYANSTPASVPLALSGVVSAVHGLSNYRLKPRFKAADPRIIVSRTQEVGPSDFATIYDINGLYNAGITGAGQKIIVVGQSEIVASDISNFRTWNSMSAPSLTQVLVPSSPDPGIVSGDELESDLDVEWSGAVARDATVVFVYSTDVDVSTQYAIDNTLGTVLSTSYGICENVDLVDLDGERATYRKANLEGITVFAAAGDSGAADCDGDFNPEPNPPALPEAEAGLAVDAPASIPEVTAMGGTQFILGGAYWSGGKALKYNPETAWNDTTAEDQFAATGGGMSIYFTQPSWQNGFAPADGMRHVPDLAFPSSNFIDPMFVYSTDSQAGYTGASGIGGTSCAAPAMAGVMALLNQYLVLNGTIKQPGLGNINPTLYRLSQTQPAAFHDVTAGSNIVPCAPLSPGCVNGSMGWAAGTGYDSATGLGSVDVGNLAQAWSSAVVAQSVVVPSIVGGSPVYETGTNSWQFTLTLNNEGSVATTLTALTINGADYSSQISSIFGTASIPAGGSISGKITVQNVDVSSGPAGVLFNFSGTDAGGAAWNNSMTIPFSGPFAALSVATMSNAASYDSHFAPGMLIGVYGAGMGNIVEQATALPLPQLMGEFQAYVAYGAGFQNFVPASLLYVSPTQVNVQIPYEIPIGPAQLQLTNASLIGIVTLNFTVQDTAPGIFSWSANGGASSPVGGVPAHIGDKVSIYITGAGRLNPAVEDGFASAGNGKTSAPLSAVSLTVGGVPVATPSFIGEPSWAAGVVEIDFTIPNGVPVGGPQNVVVTVGSIQSLPANIDIE